MVKKKTLSTKAKVGIGLGAAAAIAAVAGTYFFTGKEGAKNRKKVATWADKAKKEVVKGVRSLESINKKAYHSAVDGVMKGYEALKDVDKKEVATLARELKGHWDSIQKDIAKSSVVKSVKAKVKAGTSAVKKITKKTAKKK